jgi:predicted transcriptional regulator of viral defense system
MLEAPTTPSPLRLGNVNLQKLVSYVRRFGSHAVAQRLGFIIGYIEEKRKIQMEPEILEELKHLIGSKIYLLDVKSSKKGGISKK